MVAGQWSGALSNNRELITVAAFGRIIQQFTYQDQWYPITDGRGYSLEIVDPSDPNLDNWNRADSWRFSRTVSGYLGIGNATAAGSNERTSSV